MAWLPSHPSKGSQDDIQSLLDECDRMQRNWDLADLGLPSKNGRTGRRKVKKSDANGSQIRDMLSWALARHQALDAKDECIPMEAETTAMADALQDAKDALADAKLRMRVAEASQREKIREKLEREMGQARRRSSATSDGKATPRPTPREEANNESKEVAELPVPPASKIPEQEASGEQIEVKQEEPQKEDQPRPIPLVPKPPNQDPTYVRLPRWKVIGGVGKGGIIVREKRDLQSQQFEERLSTGALVEQTELIGDRLRYSRVSGSGPDTGWVSIRMAHKDLLVLMKPPLRHWRSELVPVLRSSSAQSERRPTVSLPRLPQPKSAPPVTGSGRQDQCRLPPL